MEFWGIWIGDGKDMGWQFIPGTGAPYCAISKTEAEQYARRHFPTGMAGLLPDEVIALNDGAARALKNWLEIKRLRIELEKAQG